MTESHYLPHPSMGALLDIPIHIIRVELEVQQPIRFKHFFHGNVIRSLLLHLFKPEELYQGHNLPPGVVPVPVENGFVQYAPGEGYVFGIVLVGRATQHLNRIHARLNRNTQSDHGPLCLGKTVRFKHFHAQELPLPAIAQRIARKHLQQFRMQLLTPMWIDREAKDQIEGHTRYDRQRFRFDVLVKKIFDRLNNLLHMNVIDPPIPRFCDLPAFPDNFTLQKHYLTWVELPTKKYRYNYGGVVGTLWVKGPLNTILLPLLIGQFLHIGEKINFGFGYYDLPDMCPELRRFWSPAQSYRDKMIQPAVLEAAFQKVKAKSKMPGIDGMELDQLEVDYDHWAGYLARQVTEGTYQCQPLMGIVIQDRKRGKLRALAVPTLMDRWLQRALLILMEPALDTLLEDCSYAYRKNYSRQRAREALRIAYNEGYRYVLESDIENFFDEVEWDILFRKLEALFPYEPVVQLLRQWVRADVEFQGQRIARHKGLPQGAVVSPLLSNLYLDEFDEKLKRMGFRLIRFADDFVVVCKSREEAEAAQQAAQKALAQLDLEMKASKTRITHFDQGFHYLGYLFCRSVILEQSKPDAEAPFRWELLDETCLPPHSWLARCRISGKTVEEFIQQTRYKTFRSLFERSTHTVEIPERKTIYLGNYRQQVRLKHRALRIESRDSDIPAVRYPLPTIQSLVLLSSIPVSMPTLYRLLKHNIPVFFCSSMGTPIGLAHPFGMIRPTVWQHQMQRFRHTEFALQFSQEVVKAKIHNACQCLRFAKDNGIEETVHDLLELLHSCENKTTLSGLRGVEGRAAALFYRAFAQLLGAEWGFPGRRKRPPTDPINALLSLGYTILYHHLTLIVLQAGLNPWLGIYHRPREQYCALSTDLQEEFRFLIDRLILTLVRRRQIRPEDFPFGEKTGRMYRLPKKCKAWFIEKVEERLLQPIHLRHPEGQFTYREIMALQVEQLKQIVLGKRSRYRAFRRR